MGHTNTQPLRKKAIAVVMSFVMAFSLMPLPGYSVQAYAGDLATGGAIRALDDDPEADPEPTPSQEPEADPFTVKFKDDVITYGLTGDEVRPYVEVAKSGEATPLATTNQASTIVGGVTIVIEYANNKTAGNATAKVTVTSTDPSATFEKTLNFTIVAPTLSDYMSHLYFTDTATGEAYETVYNGAAQVPKFAKIEYLDTSVSPSAMKQTSLHESTDYTYSYDHNVDAGTAYVILKGAGKYSGSPSVTRSFTIKPAKLSESYVTVKLDGREIGDSATALVGSIAELPAISVFLDGNPSAIPETEYKVEWSKGTTAITADNAAEAFATPGTVTAKISKSDAGANFDSSTRAITIELGSSLVEVTKSGDSEATPYESVEKAFASLGSGTYTVKLLDDAMVSSALSIPSGANVTLDLGGHKLTSDIDNSGTLTIGAAGEVSGTVTNRGTLAISDGTFSGTVATAAGETNISGGTFTGANPVTRAGGTVNISGGSFTNGDKVAKPSGSGVLYPEGKALVKGSEESAYTVQYTLKAYSMTITPESATVEPGSAVTPTVTVKTLPNIDSGTPKALSDDNYTLKYSWSGNTDKDSLPATMSAGTYTVKAVGAAGTDYYDTWVSATFTVSVAVASVTAGSKTTPYTDFEEALKAASGAGAAATIKLLGDVSVTERYKNEDESHFMITGDVTLDLNGHKVQATVPAVFYPRRITEGQAATFTVDDTSEGATGSIEAPYSPIQAAGHASVVIKNGTVKATSTNEEEHGYAIAVFDDSSVEVKGGHVVAREAALISNGSANYPNSKIVVEGGLLESTSGCAVYAPSIGGTTEIKGGTITGTTGIELRAGTLKVTGGTITGAMDALKSEANNNGTTTDGAGIAVVQHSTNQAINVEISGSAIIQGHCALYQTQKDGNQPNLITINVSGGTFDSPDEQRAVNIESTIAKQKFITAGKFKSDPTNYIDDSTSRIIGTDSVYGYYIVGTKAVAKPTVDSLESKGAFMYNGAEQTVFKPQGFEGYVAVAAQSTVSATDAGDYKIVFIPAAGCAWEGAATDAEKRAPVSLDWSISKKSLSDAKVTLKSAELPYTDKAQENEVQVVSGNIVLAPTDFDITYGPSSSLTGGKPVNVGDYTVKVTGKGNYTGSPSETPSFKIAKAEYKKPEDLVTFIPDLKYDGTVQTGVTVRGGITGVTLSGDKETNVGSHTATVTLDGNHVWGDGSVDAKTVSWSIAKGVIASITPSTSAATYTGSAITPSVTVKDSKDNTVDPSQYSLGYKKGDADVAEIKDAGTYTVTLNPGSNYELQTSLLNTFSFVVNPASPGSGGNEPEPTPTTTPISVPAPAVNLVYDGTEKTGVQGGTGYTLSGDFKATDAGEYTATATLADGYTWSGKEGSEATDPATITWSIAKRRVASPQGPVTLQGNGTQQVVMAAAIDYLLDVVSGTATRDAYGNIVATSGTGTISATLKDAKNNQWDDSTSNPKTIVWFVSEYVPPVFESDEPTISLSGALFTYTGLQIKPAVTVRNSSGSSVSSSSYRVEYGPNVEVGIGYVYVDYQGKRYTQTFTIGRAAISAATSISTQTYSGKSISPKVNVYAGSMPLTENADYTITYSNNVKVGTAQAVIIGKGNYTGSVTKQYRINPQGTKIKKLSKASKGFKVKWSKQRSETSGYQIQYSKNKSFKASAVTKTINKNGATSSTVKTAKGKQRYYVRIRTFKNVNGQKFYSAWSGAKSVKTK